METTFLQAFDLLCEKNHKEQPRCRPVTGKSSSYTPFQTHSTRNIQILNLKSLKNYSIHTEAGLSNTTEQIISRMNLNTFLALNPIELLSSKSATSSIQSKI